MAIEKKSLGAWFNTGRGNVSGEVAKTNEEVTHEESEIYEDDEIFPSQEGDRANKEGAKPIFTTGETPFHTGRGLGRGHGKD
jgi:hypothetical protein